MRKLDPPKKIPVGVCPQCIKKPEFCLCSLHPEGFQNKLEVVFIQHPQEPDVDLGTARMAALHLSQAQLRVGLSWKNLAQVLGRENVEPKRWGVLYLGSGIQGATDPANVPTGPGLYEVNKNSQVVQKLEDHSLLDGLIILDGTWSQAKTLWWRNPWLLKLRRLVLIPKEVSAYGRLRNEPRRECLSTLETTSACLSELHAWKTPEDEKKFRGLFFELLRRVRESKKKTN